MASKRTDLPHVVQKFDWDCGIACLQMILLKLGQIFDESALYGVLPNLSIGKSVWSIDLANILRHFNVDFVYYTITCGVDPGYRDETFYKKLFDTEETRINSLFKKAEEIGIKIIKSSIMIADIFSKLDNGYIAVILVNSNLLKCKSCDYPWINIFPDDNSELEEFGGHYLVLYGYDSKEGVIFCKNPSSTETECCMEISSIDQARKSYGTDEDIIFINMNSPKDDV